MKAFSLVLLALVAPAVAQGAAERLTDKCPTVWAAGIMFNVDPAFSEQIAAVVKDPTRDGDLFERLWRPIAYNPGTAIQSLDYDQRQDMAQIRDEVRSDPVLAARGMRNVGINSYLCLPLQQAPVPVTLTEYRNTILEHYFLSSSAAENAFIDSGGAGPGWQRTGETFSTQSQDFCYGTNVAVHRFYGPGPRSHVFTPDVQECGLVRKAGTGWLYEGVAFAAYPAVNGACAAGKTAVWRLYNNRALQNDSNHRYVARQSLIEEMTRRGWALEGVAFCVNP